MKAWVITVEETIIINKKKYRITIEFDKDGDSLFETIMNAIENEQIKKKGEEDEYECIIA